MVSLNKKITTIYLNMKFLEVLPVRYIKYARGIIVIVIGNGHGDTSSILDETDCISHSTNTPGKDMNQILPPAMGI